jgi:haloalkane dehalogenase
MIVNQPDTKLFIDTDPAGLLIKGQRDFCRKWPNQQVVTRKARIFLWRHLLSKLIEVGEAAARFVQKVLAGQIVQEVPETRKVA